MEKLMYIKTDDDKRGNDLMVDNVHVQNWEEKNVFFFHSFNSIT